MWVPIIFVCLFLTGCEKQIHSCPSPPPPPPDIGKYQLVSGESERLFRSSVLREKTMFRIDTVTGKVERWAPKTLGDKADVDMWLPTE